MPQLDKLTFASQIFWLFFLFGLFYYSFVRISLVRLKLDLGFKHFYFQDSSFYKLLRKYNKGLPFFYKGNYEKEATNYIERAEKALESLEKEDKYSLILEIDNDYYGYLLNTQKPEIDLSVSEQINKFIDTAFGLFSVMYKMKRYGVYESMLYSYVAFLSTVVEEKEVLFLKTLPEMYELEKE
jgi:hypothetical protein